MIRFASQALMLRCVDGEEAENRAQGKGTCLYGTGDTSSEPEFCNDEPRP